MLKGELVSDIILRITRGKPSDDLELEPTQVAYWANLLLPKLIQESLNDRLKRGEDVDPSYIKVEECKVIVKKDENCANGDCIDRYIATLDYPVVQLWKDRGMVQVITSEFEDVHRISLDKLFLIKNLKFSKPQGGNLVYARVNQSLYVYGLIDGAEEELKLIVSYVPKQDIQSLNDSDSIYVGDDIMDDLADNIEKKARRQQFEGLNDEENDGEQEEINAGQR